MEGHRGGGRGKEEGLAGKKERKEGSKGGEGGKEEGEPWRREKVGRERKVRREKGKAGETRRRRRQGGGRGRGKQEGGERRTTDFSHVHHKEHPKCMVDVR